MLSELPQFIEQVKPLLPLLEGVLNDAGLLLTAVDASERLQQLWKLRERFREELPEEKLPHYNVLQVSVRRAYLQAVCDLLSTHTSQTYAQDIAGVVNRLKQDIDNLNIDDDKNALLKGKWMLSYDGIHQLLPFAQGNTDTFKEDLGEAVRTELNDRFGADEFRETLIKLVHRETDTLLSNTQKHFYKEYQTSSHLQAAFTGAMFVHLISREEPKQARLPEDVKQHLDVLWSQLREQISTDNQASAELLKQHINHHLGAVITVVNERFDELSQQIDTIPDAVANRLWDYESQRERTSYEPKRIVGEVLTQPVFEGRQKELADVRESVVTDENRFTQVCNPSGWGKTALITRFINEDSHFDSIVFVSLRENRLATFDKIVDYLLETLPSKKRDKLQNLKSPNIIGQQDVGTPKKQDVSQQITTMLQDCIAEHKTLIVLDNLENALEDRCFRKEYTPLKAFIADVVQLDQHACQILVTSQQTLNITSLGRGLGGFAKNKRIGIDENLDEGTEEGLSLADRCKILRGYGKHSGILQTEPEALLQAVAEKLGGIPLALVNFVTALLDDPTLTLEACLQKPDFLEGLRDEPAKVLYENLSEDARTVFKGLAVFGKRVPEEAICYLYPELDTETILKRLVNDFVQLDKTQPLQITYALHSSNQEYAYKQLAEDERQELHKKAAAFYRDLHLLLDEFEQLVGAEAYDEACRVLTSIDDDLMRWGNVALVRDLHLQLRNRVADKALRSIHLGSLGNAYNNLSEIQSAIHYYKQALKISCEIRDRQSEGIYLNNLGDAYRQLGETQSAIGYFKRRLKISREIHDQLGERNALGNLGVVYSDLGEVQSAITYYKKALKIFGEPYDRLGEGTLLNNLGDAYRTLGETQSALDHYEEALKIAREFHDRRGEGNALGNLGNIYTDLGETQTAIDHYERGLKISREIHNRRGEGIHLGNLGSVYRSLGKIQSAIDYFGQSLKISREIHDRRNEGIWLGGMGNAYRDLGEIQSAIDYFEEALKISREIHNQRHEVSLLGNLGLVYRNLGEMHSAIKHFEQGLKISREIHDRQSEEIHLGNLGLAHRDLGEIHSAIDCYEEALKISCEIHNRRGEGIHLGDLGSVYHRLGEVRRAIEYYEQALKIAREFHDRRGEGADLGNLGNAYRDLGKTHSAIDYYKKALKISRDLHDRRSEALLIGNLGNAYNLLGEIHSAIDHYKQALDIVREVGDKVNEGLWLGNIGLAYAGRYELPKKLACLVASMSIYEGIELPEVQRISGYLAQHRYYPKSSNPFKVLQQWLFGGLRRASFDMLVRFLFPDGDAILNEATGQNYTFFRDAPADMPERILALIDQYAQDTE
jgi:tetratricopeptide (TPR) repeat protein